MPTSPQKPAKRSYGRAPVIIDLDLNNNGTPMATFLGRFSTEEDRTRYLLIAYWLKTYGQTEEIGIDHIHTCYRHMDWSTPKYPVQPMQDLVRKKNSFSKGEEEGSTRSTTLGRMKY